MTETPAQPSTTPRPKRRWLQFKLRTLLVLTLMFGSGFGWVVSERRKNIRLHSDVDSLKRLGCLVRFSKKEPRDLDYIDWLTARSLPEPVVAVSAVIAPGSRLVTLVQDSDLIHLKGFSRLETLQLGWTKVSNSGLVHIRQLRRLKELDLQFTAVSDDGVKHLSRLTQLENLDLQFTAVSDDGVKHLSRLIQLESLNLRGTKITESGLAELQKALPNCQIRHD